jgi:hypothetical protein
MNKELQTLKASLLETSSSSNPKKDMFEEFYGKDKPTTTTIHLKKRKC